MQHLFHLHRALSTLIHRSQYIERADALFATGLIHLTPTPPILTAHSSGGSASANFTYFPTPTISTTSFPPIQSTSSSSSTPNPLTAVTINTATSTLAPLLSASPTASAIGVPSSNNSKTTSRSQPNSLCAIGKHTTTSTTTPPSNFPHMTHTTRRGFTNAT